MTVGGVKSCVTLKLHLGEKVGIEWDNYGALDGSKSTQKRHAKARWVGIFGLDGALWDFWGIFGYF